MEHMALKMKIGQNIFMVPVKVINQAKQLKALDQLIKEKLQFGPCQIYGQYFVNLIQQKIKLNIINFLMKINTGK